jgi:hypothetical protein
LSESVAAALLNLHPVSTPLASAAVTKPGDCRRPQVPARFHKQVVTAIRASGNLPMAWADSPSLAKIVC